MYVKQSKKSFIMFSLYVDDILLVENDKELIVVTKEWLLLNFDMSYISEVEYILEIMIYRDFCIFLNRFT